MNAAVIAAPRAWLVRAHAGSWVVSTSLLLVAAISPFERPLPGPPDGFTLTTVEMAVLAALVAWAVVLVRDRRLPAWRSPLAAPGAAVLIVVLVSALVAPEFGGNSLKFFGRLAAAALVLLLTQNVIVSVRAAGHVIATLLAVGAVVGTVAVLELAQVGAVLDGLKAFRPGFHVVGGQLRATSTLFYPTIASMYLEVVFALGLFWLSGRGADRGSTAGSRSPEPGARTSRARVLAFAALTLVAAGVVATFTRAGLITMALSLLCVGGLRHLRHRRWDGGQWALAALAAVVVMLIALSRSPQLLVARMSAEGSQAWYGAGYDVPETMTMLPGGIYDVPVTLTNNGWLTWQSRQAPVFALAYHWLSAGAEEVVIYDGMRTRFENPVEPGQAVSMLAQVRVPGYPGSYVLVWDVVHEHRTWLSVEGVLPGRTRVTVAGKPQVSGPLSTHGRMPMGSVRLPRLTLWKAALDIAGERPLLGIGPDNFRHVYGRYLGLVTWDTRVHANNAYLEALAGAGLVGAAAVGWFVLAMSVGIWKRWAAIPDAVVPLFAATAAACLAIAAHALVDSFITFTPTYVIFAIAVGLTFSPAVSGGDTPSRGDKPLGLSWAIDTPEGVSPQVESNAHRV